MKLWVVEMWVDTLKRRPPHWGATVGVALTRSEGLSNLHEWRTANPPDKFRLVQYRRSGDPSE
jgi:hypothetical protein